jgi:hypothetical protein
LLLLLSEKIKRTVIFEIASHTWCFFWHAAIVMHYDPQLSQGLTVDEKRASMRDTLLTSYSSQGSDFEDDLHL